MNKIDDPAVIFPLQFWRPLIDGLLRRETRRLVLGFMGAVIRDFWWQQLRGVRWLTQRQVVMVDHELDALIPYDPSTIQLYMSFIRLWAACAWCAAPKKGDRSRVVRMLQELCWIYRQAGRVYRRIQSTSWRPPPGRSLSVYLLHRIDPHYNCIPSLHVWVVCLSWISMLEKRESEQVFRIAIAIIESVLLMKQHSINCVASSLYVFHRLYSNFTLSMCHRIIDELFTSRSAQRDVQKRPSPENAAAIRQALRDGVVALQTADTGSDPLEILEGYLRGFAAAGYSGST